MARTLQTRKRSRPLGRARPMKKRRLTRRKKTTSYYNSVSGRVSGALVNKGRKLRPRKYRSLLWSSTFGIPKYRVQNTIAATTATPANLLNYTYVAQQMFVGLGDMANWTNADGVDPTAVKGSIVMRGGYSRFSISSIADEVIDYRLYVIWVKPGGTPPATGSIGKSYDLGYSNVDTSNETCKVVKTWSGLLDRSQVVSFIYRPRIKKYDTTLFTTGNDCLYWYLGLGNTIDSLAVNVTYVQTYNVSVAADVTA